MSSSFRNSCSSAIDDDCAACKSRDKDHRTISEFKHMTAVHAMYRSNGDETKLAGFPNTINYQTATKGFKAHAQQKSNISVPSTVSVPSVSGSNVLLRKIRAYFCLLNHYSGALIIGVRYANIQITLRCAWVPPMLRQHRGTKW